jgi:PhnB protein
MAKAKSYAPEGIRTLTPTLTLKNARAAIAWYQKAFGAEVRTIAEGPTPGSTIHSEIRIGDSALFLVDEMPGAPSKSPESLGAVNAGITMYFPDCDAVYKQAVAAGAQVVMKMEDMFWGDRFGTLRDPFGCLWSIATHKEDVSREEMERRTREFFAAMAKQQKR